MASAKDFVRDSLQNNPHFKNINMVNPISRMRTNKGGTKIKDTVKEIRKKNNFRE